MHASSSKWFEFSDKVLELVNLSHEYYAANDRRLLSVWYFTSTRFVRFHQSTHVLSLTVWCTLTHYLVSVADETGSFISIAPLSILTEWEGLAPCSHLEVCQHSIAYCLCFQLCCMLLLLTSEDMRGDEQVSNLSCCQDNICLISYKIRHQLILFFLSLFMCQWTAILAQRVADQVQLKCNLSMYKPQLSSVFRQHSPHQTCLKGGAHIYDSWHQGHVSFPPDRPADLLHSLRQCLLRGAYRWPGLENTWDLKQVCVQVRHAKLQHCALPMASNHGNDVGQSKQEERSSSSDNETFLWIAFITVGVCFSILTIIFLLIWSKARKKRKKAQKGSVSSTKELYLPTNNNTMYEYHPRSPRSSTSNYIEWEI